ncbi:MAG TPA: ATP-dependent DNA ligase [Actinomycetota bacterium]|nr:ATP-dependent DNA ligase [Actinomycetota bacterium]
MTLFADVVAASSEVASTSSRSKKIGVLADLLRRLKPDEVGVVVGFLSGAARQGKVGIGYAAVYRIEVEHAATPVLEVLDIDCAIDEVQRTTGPGSAGTRREILEGLLGRATAGEADFIRRLFTGELRQGALAGLMIDAIAKASEIKVDIVRRALMLSGDLPGTAELALTHGEDALRAVGFEIFRPILPMLASTAPDVATAIDGLEAASVDWKLDGIRIQIHRRDDEVRIYTRGLNDITGSLPGIVDAVRALEPRTLVCDGEAIGMWGEGPASFQETMSRIDTQSQPAGIVTFLFDVLHVDGEDLLDTPLRDRLATLERIAPKLRIPGVITGEPSEAQRVYEESLAAGHEGVVVKDASSTYIAGRRGKAWRKVKPHETYDLVVLGAEWGHGRRRGWLSNLHLGARDPSTGEFVMVGKCFKGLTDELLEWQTKALLAIEDHRKGIAVFVRPELVVEIALDGVLQSPRYPGGIAMRFARVRRYRDDKPPQEADTIDTLRALLRRES